MISNDVVCCSTSREDTDKNILSIYRLRLLDSLVTCSPTKVEFFLDSSSAAKE